MVLVTGPTGSGKTTTLYAALSEIKTEAVSRAVATLTANATKASSALVRLLDSEDEKVILATATKILTLLAPLQDLAELRDRVDQIERQAQLRLAR